MKYLQPTVCASDLHVCLTVKALGSILKYTYSYLFALLLLFTDKKMCFFFFLYIWQLIAMYLADHQAKTNRGCLRIIDLNAW